MVKVRLKNATRVNLPKDAVVEVSEQEATRLLAFAIADKVEEPKAEKPTKKAKKG